MAIETKHHEPLVYRIYDYLKDNHVGQANAISAKSLGAIFDLSPRQIRFVIRKIRNSTELEKLVASDNSGYYICADEQEYEKANNRLCSAAIDLFRTVQANKRKAGMNGQCKIKLGAYYKEFVEAFGE